jgi:hypothetical protein
MKIDSAGRHDLWVTLGGRSKILGKEMYIAAGLVDDNGVLVFRVREISSRAPRSSLANLQEHFGNQTDWLDLVSGETAFFGYSLIDKIERFRVSDLHWTYDLSMGALASIALAIQISNSIFMKWAGVKIGLHNIELRWLLGIPESTPRPVSFEGDCQATIGGLQFEANLLLRDGRFVLEAEAAGSAVNGEAWTNLMKQLRMSLLQENSDFSGPNLCSITLGGNQWEAFAVDDNDEMLEWEKDQTVI